MADVLEHIRTAQWYERGSVWTQCSCGEKWSQDPKRSQEVLDDLFRRHKKHFDDKTLIL